MNSPQESRDSETAYDGHDGGEGALRDDLLAAGGVGGQSSDGQSALLLDGLRVGLMRFYTKQVPVGFSDSRVSRVSR